MRRFRAFAHGLGAALLALGLATGCTTNPFTGERQVSKTTKGAGIGAAAGAAAGALAGDGSASRRKRALIGAGVGTLAGGAVGYYMDRQEAKLRERLQGTGVSVTRAGENLLLNMPGNVTFEFDRATIRPQFYAVLNSVSEVLKEFDKTVVEITGYTDSVGPDAYNQELSERRAESVAEYLGAQQVNRMRLVPKGRGERDPVATNETSEGREQNRRVELKLVPVTA